MIVSCSGGCYYSLDFILKAVETNFNRLSDLSDQHLCFRITVWAAL